jgi:hypothetical protein
MFKSSSSNTVFSKNVSITFGNGDSDNQVQLEMYKKLSDVVETINILMKEYYTGNFYAVSNILTQQAYNALSLSLANIAVSANKYPRYETIRTSTTSALGGLYQSVLQYSEYLDVQAQLELSRERESILHDRVKLREYIEKMNQNRRLFPDSVVQATKATLKPEYAEYVKHFGFPEGAIFEPDKLAFILQKLNMV